MVPLLRTAVLTKKQLCVTLNLISQELMKTGGDSEDRELAVNLFTNDSVTLRPNSSNMN